MKLYCFSKYSNDEKAKFIFIDQKPVNDKPELNEQIQYETKDLLYASKFIPGKFYSFVIEEIPDEKKEK